MSVLIRRRHLAVISVAACIALSGPARAHAGFLDELFGGALTQPQQPQQLPGYEVPGYGNEDYQPRRAKPRKKVVSAKPSDDEKPVLQKTTDLMRDPTLQRGDAVMMKDGIHIYSGPEASVHNPRQFQPLDRAKAVGSTQRTRLAAADTTRNDPLRKEKAAPDTLASGRSAAMGTPITKGYKITDARGNSIRYVGP